MNNFPYEFFKRFPPYPPPTHPSITISSLPNVLHVFNASLSFPHFRVSSTKEENDPSTYTKCKFVSHDRSVIAF